MNARLLGVFVVVGLFISLCSPVGLVSAVPSPDGELNSNSGGVVTDVENSRSTDHPFAEAGLDQTVPVGATVYLDAYGSRAAEGTLTGYEWRIERPDGTIIVPDCPTCELTEFRPTQSGQYNVSVTVEDEAGRTASDTMYVTVLDKPAPNVSLTGPAEMQLNETAQIDLDASAPTGELAAVEWYVDGEYREGRFLDTTTLSESLEFSPDAVGRHTVSAVVRNDNGTARRVRHAIIVRRAATFEVEITSAAETVEAGQSWTPNVEVTNTDGFEDTQEISLSIQGGPGVVDTETVTLGPGDSITLTDQVFCSSTNCSPALSWFTSPGDDGSYTAAVSSETNTTSSPLTVAEPPNFEIEIRDITGDADDVEYEVTNTGGVSDTQDIQWSTDRDSRNGYGGTAESDVTLDAGESVEKTWNTNKLDPDEEDKLTMRTDDDADRVDIPDPSTNSVSSSASPGVPEIRFSASDVEVGDFATATVTSVAGRTGSIYSPTDYISGNDEIKGFAFKDMSVFGADGAVNLRGEPLAAGDGTTDETIRYKGVSAGTGELVGDVWSDRYDANLAPSDDSDTFTVRAKGGGGGGGDDEDNPTGGIGGTISPP